MNFILKPWLFLFVLFCGWGHQRLTEIIEFQNDQLAALMQSEGRKRILLTGDQRRYWWSKASTSAGKHYCS